MQLGAENLRRDLEVRHLLRVDVHGHHRRAERQRLSAPVVDRAARRGNLDGFFLPRPRHADILVVTDDLQREQFAEDDYAPENDKPGEPFETTLHHKLAFGRPGWLLLRGLGALPGATSSPWRPCRRAAFPGGTPGSATASPDSALSRVSPTARG